MGAEFLGANAPAGKQHWRPLTDADLEHLRIQSRIRVEQNEDLKKVTEDLREAEEKLGVLKLSELLEKNEEEKEEEDAPEGEEDEPTPQLEEALSVLADWVTKSSPPLKFKLSNYGFLTKSGNLAIFTAIHRAV